MRVRLTMARSTGVLIIFELASQVAHLARKIPGFPIQQTNQSPGSTYADKHFRRVLWYLFSGTRGGPNRAEIIKTLETRPCNANKLAELLKVDYKTIQHHIRVLEEHGLVTPSEKGAYGAVLFLSSKMEEALPVLDEIWSKIGRRKISGTDQVGQ